MNHRNVLRAVFGLGLIVTSAPVWCDQDRFRSGGKPSVIALPAKPPPYWAGSVTLSPNGRWLAVTAGSYLVLVRDVRSGRWTRTFRAGLLPPGRWHPSKPVLIAPGGSADKPAFYIAHLSSGKVRQLFRSDPDPFAWSHVGLLFQDAVRVLDARTAIPRKWGNLGHSIPWSYGAKARVNYLAPTGPNDRVAAEVQSLEESRLGSPQWVETYRKLRGRKQWVRSGRIGAEVKGKTLIWYPRNPNWLGDGRLVYLRIYPAQWIHSRTRNGRENPKARTARNRAELWVCNANGSQQRKITTLWDLRPFEEEPSSDWITVSRTGRTLYYLDWDRIRVVRFNRPL